LRVSDVLKLKVKDVKCKSHLMIYEQKTGKYKRFKINQELQQHILSYTANMDVEEYLFKSLRSPFPIKRESASQKSVPTLFGKHLGTIFINVRRT
jgi:integrase